ncbi:MAG TPA: NAD(P)-dependent oxidoreductase [Candidatus Baltobacteraceae bacterium]|jgi:3-hydroxyisobutyrate dehydrogenase
MGTNLRVGVVGLGKMGSALARNWLAHHYSVAVWNRSPQAATELAKAGATPFSTIESMIAAVDCVVTMLWGDEVAREVSLAKVVPAATASTVLVEMSTLSPQMYSTLAAAAADRHVRFIAAPVLGSVDQVRAGTLTVLAGGDAATIDVLRPLLGCLGTVTSTGSPAASGFLKLANNVVLGIFAEAEAELLELCVRAGLDRHLAVESITGAFERAARSKLQQILDDDERARFSLDALLKDLRLASAASESAKSPIELLQCVLPRFTEAADRGLGDRDYIALTLERLK